MAIHIKKSDSRQTNSLITNKKIHTTKDAITVIGLGYVGLPLALLARAKGYEVFGIDTDSYKRSQIRSVTVPDLGEDFLQELKHKPLNVSGAFGGISLADIVIICVPTPVDHEHNPDLTPVISACERVAAHLYPGQLVILESTVHPGTCEEIIRPILEKQSGLKAGVDFGIAHCPERINPGDDRWPVQKIPRVVGAINNESLKRAAELYRSILDAPVYEMASLREAEAVKVVENSFRDINIAFVNELAMSFSKLNIDVVNVLKGASTKPFGFMPHFPGCGVGGHCIPVDPYYLIRYAKKNGFSHDFLALARSINEKMPRFTVDTALAALKDRGIEKKDAVVTVLGLSYKAGISDMRESPSFEIVHLLKEAGVRVKTFDPHVPESSSEKNLEEALRGSDAVIVATAHKEFAALTPEICKNYGLKVVIDGRNCLDHVKFQGSEIMYRGIGR